MNLSPEQIKEFNEDFRNDCDDYFKGGCFNLLGRCPCRFKYDQYLIRAYKNSVSSIESFRGSEFDQSMK